MTGATESVFDDEDEEPSDRPSDETFLSEPDDEAVPATPEAELLNDVTQHYLNEIGAKPLFTPDEERVFLGVQGANRRI